MYNYEIQNTQDDYFLRLIAYFKKSVAEPYPRKPLPLKWSQFDEFRQSLIVDSAPINIELTW